MIIIALPIEHIFKYFIKKLFYNIKLKLNELKINKNIKLNSFQLFLEKNTDLTDYSTQIHYFDEINDCEVITIKMLKGIRLKYMQETTDYVIPAIEAEMLLTVSEQMQRTHGRKPLIIHNYSLFTQIFSYFFINNHNNIKIRNEEFNENLHPIANNTFTDTIKLSRYSKIFSSKMKLIKYIENIRNNNEIIKHYLETITNNNKKNKTNNIENNNYEKENYLMKKFIIIIKIY